MSFRDRLIHSWNAFMNKDPTYGSNYSGMSSSYRPDRVRLSRGNDRSVITAIYNRIALDCAAIHIEHVRLDENGRYIETIDDGLNSCLTLSANKDQTARAFLHDVYLSLFDEGDIAVVPIDTDFDPTITGSYDIDSMRVGKILEWYPDYVKVRVYNDRDGQKYDKIFPKSAVVLLENPFYAVMNEPNSTVQRLIRKLNILDTIDEQTGSGKLDLIIQLPYSLKTDARRQQAEQRLQGIEDQLANSKLGIAYIDATEHVTQLNRSVDNQLLSQIDSLYSLLYSQLSITTSIMDGTADEKTMLNYDSRTIEPVVSTLVDEMKRKFLTKTARSQKQSIMFFREPFKLVPVNDLAEIADKFTRNEILSSNEVRQIIGMRPVKSDKADELRNKNLNASEDQEFASTNDGEETYETEE